MNWPIVLAVLSMLVVTAQGACTRNTTDLSNDTLIVNALNMMVYCYPENITIVLKTCVLFDMNYDPDADVSLIGPSTVVGHSASKCAQATNTYDASGNTLTVVLTSVTNGTCGTVAGKTGNDNTYKNAIRNILFSNVGSPAIVRRRDFVADFMCTYPVSLEMVGPNADAIVPVVALAEATEETATGSFGSVAKLCTSAACPDADVVATGAQLTVTSFLYVVVTVPNNMKVMITKIWATSTSDDTGSPLHILLQGSCPATGETGPIINNGVGKSSFCFLVFYWNTDSALSVYFHIQWQLCDTTIEACADATCPPSRRRRSVLTDADVNTQTIGPFTAVSPVEN